MTKQVKMPREQIINRVCSAFNLKIEDLGFEEDDRFINVGEEELRCSVSQTGVVQIESRRPRWEIEFEEALEAARSKYPQSYFDALDLPALRAKAEQKSGKRGSDLIQVFRIRVNPHQRKVFDVRQTAHANSQTAHDVNGILKALWD